MSSIITPNSIALYNEYTGDIWYISRKLVKLRPTTIFSVQELPVSL